MMLPDSNDATSMLPAFDFWDVSNPEFEEFADTQLPPAPW